LPIEFRLTADRVSIRRAGAAVVLEPFLAGNWPPEFFETIRIDDPAFERPQQGELRPVVGLD
jgi:virulence-associated protein VagC